MTPHRQPAGRETTLRSCRPAAAAGKSSSAAACERYRSVNLVYLAVKEVAFERPDGGDSPPSSLGMVA